MSFNSLIGALRKLRHGRLRRFGALWLVLGKVFRFAVKTTGLRGNVDHMIGPYGPFKLAPHFSFSNFAAWGGGHNNGFVASVEAARGKKCFLDIGAHIGLVSMPVSSVLGSGGQVFAFEPSAANLSMLTSHIAINDIGNITVVPCLVGDKESEVTFNESHEASGQNSLVVKKNPERYREVTRQQTTIDLFCEQKSIAPDVIKVDVEGAELKVLAGAQRILQRYKPLIFLSVHPVEIGLMGDTLEDLEELIGSLGYICCNIDGSTLEAFQLSEYLLLPKESN